MKKIVFFAAFLTLMSGNVFAAESWSDASTTDAVTCGGTNTDSLVVPLSPRVEASYDGTSTAYVIGTRNEQGTRTFGTSHDFTGIFFADGVAGEESLPSVADSVEWASGTNWETL